LRDELSGERYNHEFVRPADLEEAEETWLRRVLQEHLRYTDSVPAARLLADASSLPLVRMEPLSLPCSVAQTWAATLARFADHENLLPELAAAAESRDLRGAELPSQREFLQELPERV
jgi:hypothetical protein